MEADFNIPNITRGKDNFDKIELTITIESKQDLNTLWCRLNVPIGSILDNMNRCGITRGDCSSSRNVWLVLDELKDSLE